MIKSLKYERTRYSVGRTISKILPKLTEDGSFWYELFNAKGILWKRINAKSVDDVTFSEEKEEQQLEFDHA